MGVFKEGDVVILKSGGPLMTVKSLGEFATKGLINGVACVWFDGNNLKEAVFNAAAVELYKEEE